METVYRDIWCVACGFDTSARLTDGREVYPNRPDLATVPFWICDLCHNFVGCHHKTKKNRTQPLGCISTPKLKMLRNTIHDLIDPLWKEQGWSRGKIYGTLSKELGYTYHTGEIRTEEEANKIIEIISNIIQNARHSRSV